MDIETKLLPVKLTDDEVRARGEELAAVRDEIVHLEAAQIEVFEEKCYSDGIARIIRRDTHEEVSTRPLRAEEMTAWRQGKLQLVVETKPAVVVTTDPNTPPENR
jgi:hypothetical protein